jgi:hypothetical protein
MVISKGDVEAILNSAIWEQKDVALLVPQTPKGSKVLNVKCYKGLCFHQPMTIRFLNGAEQNPPFFTVSHVASGYNVCQGYLDQNFTTWQHAALFLIKISSLIDWALPTDQVVKLCEGKQFREDYRRAYRETIVEAGYLNEPENKCPDCGDEVENPGQCIFCFATANIGG